MKKLKVGVVSDSHLREYDLSTSVDVLIHAGDHTFHGDDKELHQAIGQLRRHKDNGSAREIVAIGGNHDRNLEKDPSLWKSIFRENGIHYLQDDLVNIDGVIIYGAPWSPEFCGWAFATSPFADGYTQDPEEIWGKVPEGMVDILVTHGPPWGRFDVPFGSNRNVGCPELMRQLQRIKPRIHVFGHVHSPGDVLGADGIRYINASVCNGLYERKYEPTIFEIESKDIL